MLIINDLPEVQESMPESAASQKKKLLDLYARLHRAQAVLPADLLPCSALETAQLSAALRFHHRVGDFELRHAVEVRS